MLTKLRYQLDLTGELPENRVEHNVTIGAETNRSFALPTGPFYTDNLVIIDNAKPQTPLVRGVDYECVYLYSSVVKMARGKEVTGVVVIINPDVSTDLVVHANVVGSVYVNQYELLTRVIEDLGLDQREVEFWRIEGIPEQWEAAPHLQDIGDIFGFEYHVSILAELVSVIAAGATPELNSIISGLGGIETRLKAIIQAHIDSEGNVHNVTPGQIGTYTSSQIDTFLNNLNNAIAEVVQRIGQNESGIVQLNQHLDSINALFVQHTETLAAIRDDFTAVESWFGDVNEELARLKSVDEQQQGQINAITADLARNWEDQAELLQKINANIAEIEKLKQTTQTHDSRITALEEALAQLINDFNAHVAAAKAKWAELQDAIDLNSREIEAIKVEIAALKQADVGLSNYLAGLDSRVAKLEKEEADKYLDLAGVRVQFASTKSGNPGWVSAPANVWFNRVTRNGAVYTSAEGVQVQIRAYYAGNQYVPATAYTPGYWVDSKLSYIEIVPINAAGKFVALDGTSVSETNLRNDRPPQYTTINIYSAYATVFFKKL